MRRLVFLLAAAVLCGCKPGGANVDGSSDEAAGDDSSQETTGGSEDLPPVAECQDVTGPHLDLANPEWSLEGTAGTAFLGHLIDDNRVYLWAKQLGGEAPDSYELVELDLEQGTASTPQEHPLFGLSPVLARHPGGDLLAVQTSGHRILIQRISQNELIDSTELTDDHPHPGWDGGYVLPGLIDAREDDFTFLGQSRGEEEPNGASIHQLWRKRYEYGEPDPIETEFIGPESAGTNFTPGAWVAGDTVFGDDGDLVRMDSSGAEVWREGFSVAKQGIGLLASSGERQLWRYTTSSEFNDSNLGEGLSWVTPDNPPVVEEVWFDKHCSRRVLGAAKLVKGGSEIVLFAGSAEDDMIYVHRIDAANGSALATAQIPLDDSGPFFSIAFETQDGRIGVLQYGGNGTTALARAFFPFDE